MPNLMHNEHDLVIQIRNKVKCKQNFVPFNNSVKLSI